MEPCLLTCYMKTQYFVSFYIIINVWLVGWIQTQGLANIFSRHQVCVNTYLVMWKFNCEPLWNAKYNTGSAINGILWKWIPTPLGVIKRHRIEHFLLTAQIYNTWLYSYTRISINIEVYLHILLQNITFFFWLICLCTQVRRCINGSYAIRLSTS